MEHLSSCYFCGVAVDEPLDTYELAAASEETTITLCPSCEHKLDTVLEKTGGGQLIAAVADDGEQATGNSEPTAERDLSGASRASEDAKSREENESYDEQDSSEEASMQVEETTVSTGPDIEVPEDDVNTEPEPEVADYEREGELSADDEPSVNAAGKESTEDPTALDTDEEPLDPTGVAEEGDTEGEADEIDPSILQADDIATGKVDVDDVLGEDSDESTGGATASETLDEEIGATEIDETEDTTEPEPSESVDDGGFDFENDGESVDDVDTELQEQMEPEVPEEFGSIASEEGDEIDAADPPTDTTERDETVSEEISEQPDDESSKPSNTDDSAGRGSDGSEEKDDAQAQRRTISALEYNKVMRLLQNREFPVDRIEIETVASSAYDLSEADCAEVIDIAIDRGLLAEADGELRKPDSEE